MKKGIIIAAAVVIAVASAVSYKMYERNVYWDMMTANSNAKLVYNCLKEWCEDNGTEMTELAAEYRGGKIYVITDDGEGFAHYLHEEMSGDHYSCNNGYVYVGVGNKNGSEVIFTHWSEKQGGGITGQYPRGVFIDDYSIDTKDKVQFGIFFDNGV